MRPFQSSLLTSCGTTVSAGLVLGLSQEPGTTAVNAVRAATGIPA
jgi:hypothetical protein